MESFFVSLLGTISLRAHSHFTSPIARNAVNNYPSFLFYLHACWEKRPQTWIVQRAAIKIARCYFRSSCYWK